MARAKKQHIRTKNAPDSATFCGMSKSERFDIESIGPRAKDKPGQELCSKCTKNRDAVEYAKAQGS